MEILCKFICLLQQPEKIKFDFFLLLSVHSSGLLQLQVSSVGSLRSYFCDREVFDSPPSTACQTVEDILLRIR